MWQVSGRSDITDFEEVVKLDTEYIKNWSMGLDLCNIIRSVLTALYEPFWAALLLAVVAMFAFLYAKEHGWRKGDFFSKLIHVWFKEFRISLAFRRTFLLMFYTTMILFRTVLNRQIWFDPLGKIMGGWGLYDVDGNLTTESIENFMLFVPVTVLLFLTFREELFGKELHFKSVIWNSIKVVGIFSFAIEFVQVLFHLGTFQLSDLCYNTLGGVSGGFIYFGLWKLKNRM